MKKSLLLFVICMLMQTTFSQKITSGRVLYSVKRVLPPDYLEKVKNNYDERTREILIGMYFLNKEVESVLEFYKNESSYKVPNKLIKRDSPKLFLGGNPSESYAAKSHEYYINLKEEIFFYKTKNLGNITELVYFERPKWKLVDGEKTILGYSCKKAVRLNEGKNSKITVWYAEKIPFGFGPKMSLGLPGLVLEIENGNHIFIAKKVEINPKNIKITKPKGEIITTYKEKLNAFKSMLNEY